MVQFKKIHILGLENPEVFRLYNSFKNKKDNLSQKIFKKLTPLYKDALDEKEVNKKLKNAPGNPRHKDK